MGRLLLAFFLLASPVLAANKSCPKGQLTTQTTTGANVDLIIASASSLSVQTTITATGTATVILEQSCNAGTSWATVANSSMALDFAAAKSLVVTYAAPSCWYRTNVTACTTCNVRVDYGCGR